MIVKKNSRFDLERKRIVLFQVGLLTAGSFTLAAFNYSTPVQTRLEKAQVRAVPICWTTVEDDIKKPEIPIIKQKVDTPENNESVPTFENKAISEDVSTKKNTEELPKVNITAPNFKHSDVEITNVDVTGEELEPFPPIEAEYIGGSGQMQIDISNELVYPQIDIQAGIEGKVYVSFIVEKDGSISNVNIARGVSKTIDREAKRIVKEFPKWKPAENAYGKVRTIVRLPINFKLI